MLVYQRVTSIASYFFAILKARLDTFHHAHVCCSNPLILGIREVSSFQLLNLWPMDSDILLRNYPSKIAPGCVSRLEMVLCPIAMYQQRDISYTLSNSTLSTWSIMVVGSTIQSLINIAIHWPFFTDLSICFSHFMALMIFPIPHVFFKMIASGKLTGRTEGCPGMVV